MKHLFVAMAVLAAAAACAPAQVPQPKTADVYLAQGDAYLEDRLYDDAIANWEKVRDSFYSAEMTTLAERKIAEAYFLAERYAEAGAAYADFLKAHPESGDKPQLLYRLGQSYFRQMLSPDRDQAATQNALATFRTLTRSYPDAPEAEEARGLITLCKDRLAAHELYVGRFYLRTGETQSALHRLTGLFEQHQDFADEDEAYFLLGQAHLEAGARKEAAEAFNTLYRKYPESKYILKAQKLLEEKF